MNSPARFEIWRTNAKPFPTVVIKDEKRMTPVASPYALPPDPLLRGDSPGVYRALVSLSSTVTDELLAVHLANYRTAYQLALDRNQPGDELAQLRGVVPR